MTDASARVHSTVRSVAAEYAAQISFAHAVVQADDRFRVGEERRRFWCVFLASLSKPSSILDLG